MAKAGFFVVLPLNLVDQQHNERKQGEDKSPACKQNNQSRNHTPNGHFALTIGSTIGVAVVSAKSFS
jgi:hypothetical protein